MSGTALNSQPPTREDLYFEALEEFLRTSAVYFSVDQRMAGQEIRRDRHERTLRVDGFH